MKEVDEYPLATIGSFRMDHNSSLTTAKISIVDDNPLSRMTAADLLSLDGYEVLEVENRSAIFDRLIEQQPDLILLDAMVRGVDSFVLCRQLKQDYRTANIPIVLTTLADSREYRLKVMESGGDDILVKPLNRTELSTRVKSLLDRRRMNDGLDRAEQVLFNIAKAVDSRSVKNGGNHRVASLVTSFAQYLGLTPQAIDDLVFAARLHDIGTIAIPDAVMLKKGELTPEEKDLIRQHVLIGEEICQPLRNRSGVLPIIRNHHERWDGTGYPDGLSGDDIPYLAQIFQIIDIYDALTSDRPHKQAYTPSEALKIIRSETDKGWRNPQLVEAFTTFICSLKK